MSNSTVKIRDIIGYLEDQIARGWIAFQVSKHLYKAFQNEKITCAQYFFNSTYLACTESAVLALSRLLVPNKDSINIEYLLNTSKQNPKHFPNIEGTEILKIVQKHEQQIQTINLLVDSIKKHRDQTIAHLDKKYVNNPSTIFANPPINWVEVEKVFQLVLQIINTYKRYTDSSELELASLEQKVEDDLRYLMCLIKETDERD